MTMKLGTQTGSLINHVMSSFAAPTPEIGMGATILHWTDRHAGTIVAVGYGWFTVQRDHATRTDNYGMSDAQSYAYAPDPNGSRYTFSRVTRGKLKGAWRENGTKNGCAVLLGHRDEHYDFSF